MWYRRAMSDAGRGDGVLQRAIELVELDKPDAQALVALVRGNVLALQRARDECAAGLAGNPRNRERLEAVLRLLDAAIALATP